MQAAIISDTHDNTKAIDWIISYLNDHKIKLAFHAGDIINPGNIGLFEQNYQGELHFVFGNNDGERARIVSSIANSKKTFCYFENMDKEFEGKRIFMNHFSSTVELVAQSGQVDIAIGGHDHEYRVIEYGSCLFINPGTTSLTDFYRGVRPETEKGFVVLDLESMEHQRVMVPAE